MVAAATSNPETSLAPHAGYKNLTVYDGPSPESNGLSIRYRDERTHLIKIW